MSVTLKGRQLGAQSHFKVFWIKIRNAAQYDRENSWETIEKSSMQASSMKKAEVATYLLTTALTTYS